MATAKKFAESLAKKYRFKEDVYQTDVLFSTNGNKMFINGADIDKNTKIYEYITNPAFTSSSAKKSLTASDVDISLTPFTHDLSYTDSTIANPFPFTSLQNAFAFRQGVSDMYQFAVDLSNNSGVTGSEAYTEIDNSRNAVIAGSKPFAYKEGVSYFCTFTDDDDKDDKAELVASGLESYTKTADIPSQIQQQFIRLFFNNDGKKLYTLYKNKNKTKFIPGYAYAIKQYTLPEAFKLENATLTDLSSTTDVLVYDLSAVIDHTNTAGYPVNGAGTTENMGMYSSVPDNSLRDIVGFHFSKDGDKVFFLANRGRSKNEDSEYMGIFGKDHYFFGEVSEFSLSTPWDITSSITHNKTARFYGDNPSSTSAQDIGICPIDIDFNYNGERLNILGSEGKKQYLYTYNLGKNTGYNLPDNLDQDNHIGKPILIKDNLLISLSSINNVNGSLKNVAGSGVRKELARQCKDASVPKGNTFTINTTKLLSPAIQKIISDNNLTNVIEFEHKPKANPKSFYYDYDPTQSYIQTDKGEILISNLVPGKSTINVNGTEFTFVGMVEKKENGVIKYALVFTPIGAIGLQVRLNNNSDVIMINSQPLNSEIQAYFKEKGINLTPN